MVRAPSYTTRMYFSLGAAIWMGFKPLFKIYGTIGAGYLAAHKGILTVEAGRTISWMVLYFFMPALIFYNIASYIEDTDIKMLGVLDLSAAIYYLIGLCFGWIIYLVSPIPRGWLGGLLLCCMLNNASDMPIAYVQTIGSSELMPEGSSTLGGAYVVLFSLITNMATFNLGGTRLVAWDFARPDPHRSEPTVPLLSWKSFVTFFRRSSKMAANTEKDISEEHPNPLSSSKSRSGSNNELSRAYFGRVHSRASETVLLDDDASVPSRSTNGLRRQATRNSFLSSIAGEQDEVSVADNLSATGNYSPGQDNENELPVHEEQSLETKSRAQKIRMRWKARWNKFAQKNYATMYICHFFEDIFSPQMIALISGITVAMIPWVKRCFSNEQTIHGFRDPPDGLPPLDFIMVFLDFFAGAQIPLGLIMVGASIQRLKIGRLVPGFWRTALLVAACKLAILPIIACGWIDRLRKIGWIDKDDPLAAVVLAVGASTPSATVQVYITALHSDPNGEQLELNCFGTCLIMQYLFLPLSLTIVVAFALKNFSA